MEKKIKAKADMLKLLSKEMSDDQYSPLKEKLGKKMSKVTVMSDSPKGLEKGLSKAEEILKKRDELMGKGSESEESEEGCEGCEEGCSMCEGEDKEESPEMEDESESESEDMSKEEIMAMMKSLEAKLAKLS